MHRPGHEFIGWWDTHNSAGGTQFLANTQITANVELWARWRPTHFNITYVCLAFDSIGPVPTPHTGLEVNRTHSITLGDNRGNLRRPGYILAGWSRYGNLGNSDPDFTLGQRNVSFNESSNLPLYAHWVPQGWTNVRDVDVFLYFDNLFDESVHHSEALYRARLRTITRSAAVPFYHTFGLRMILAPGEIRVYSDKGDCCDDHMTSPDFLCTLHDVDVPAFFPSTWLATFSRRHSSGELMLHNMLPQGAPPTGSGLHTMFFAGLVCTQRANPRVLGMATMPGNRSVNSSSHYGFSNEQSFATRIVIYEWSHNYGALDWGYCGGHCIMDSHWTTVPQDLHNVWCNRCRNDILGNRELH